jgi:hypothetical protein
MRTLTQIEENHLKIFTQYSVSVTLIEPTANGLKKSIMDATASVRNYLKSKKFHDYSLQGQGSEHKIIAKSLIYNENEIYKSRASLYRPNTKKGDPRIWFSGLNKFANPNDILVLICFDETIHIINISQLDIEKLVKSVLLNPIKELLETINFEENAVANELLNLLKNIASKGLIPSMLDADTSVGRTLETALGININSSKKPDYKGIELKSFRSKRGTRKGLFTQVPNWKLSKLKSSREILDNFGYWRENVFRLYCTISASNVNSQGLSLRVDRDIEQLIEFSSNKEIGDFVIWTLEKLHSRLLEKHKETFWVAADSEIIDGKEYFQYKTVEHTKKPILSQFDLLLEQGIITIDHLIKQKTNGQVVEKGPAFKLKATGLDLLFPPSEIHDLMNAD